jgi:F0F1-type ATP synthase membrane subunit c/vacuolar-type H+-ATPase subunit K
MKFSEMSPKARKRLFLIWVLVVPIIALSTTVLVFAATQAPPTTIATATTVTATATDQLDWTTVFLALSSFLAIATSAWAAAYALARTGTAAIAGGVEKPETFFRSFLVVTLCETIAIYGLVVAILLWTKIPAI